MAFKFNKEFFDIIDNERKAYWLGFITADGCVYNNILFIKISSKDRDHILKFKYDIDSDHKIYDRQSNFQTQISSLQIGSKHLTNTLLKYNICPNKSHTISPFNFHDLDLQKAYWRGLFDGDGSISITKKGYLSVSFNGNIHMVEGFKDFLVKNGINYGSIEKHSSIFKYKTVGKKAPGLILNLLYDNSDIFLQRKYDLYLKHSPFNSIGYCQ